MRFYKILKQLENKKNNFYTVIGLKESSYIVGNRQDSFAIEYNPEKYNTMLNNDFIFQNYCDMGIKQLLVTNQKFIVISEYEKEFNFQLIDFCFEEDNEDLIEEYGDPTYEAMEDIVRKYSYHIKEVTFRTKKGQNMIILQNNGVIGIDDKLCDYDYKKIKKFIDVLNYGVKVLSK